MDIEKIEAQADQLFAYWQKGRRKPSYKPEHGIPFGWWAKSFSGAKLDALIATGRWGVYKVEGMIKFPGVHPARATQTFLYKKEN